MATNAPPIVENEPFTRWQEITQLWQTYAIQYRLLLILAFIIAGIWLFGNNGLNLLESMLGYATNVFTEALSIIVTILVLNRLSRDREQRDNEALQKRLDEQELTRLKALLGSNENVVTKIAIAELSAKGWLYDGSLNGADLPVANLENADLMEIYLIDADLSEANLAGASLINANLAGVFLSQANLAGASLSQSNLTDSDLSFAHLLGADLTLAHLEGADMRTANLKDTDLRSANLKNANMYGVRCNNKTILPDGTNWTTDVDWSKYGAVQIEDWKEWLALSQGTGAG